MSFLCTGQRPVSIVRNYIGKKGKMQALPNISVKSEGISCFLCCIRSMSLGKLRIHRRMKGFVSSAMNIRFSLCFVWKKDTIYNRYLWIGREAEKMGYIAGIGGANMDIHGRSDHGLIMRDSNPGTLHTTLGGVCRNICENLARLGSRVKLITVVGDDANGREILSGCEAAGIDMSAARVIPGERSSTYVSLMDETGDMLLAMSDMHIIKQLDDTLVDESLDVLSNAAMVVVDGNLSAQAVERLTEVCLAPLYLDPVSTAWAKEMKPFIGSFDTVKPNRMELEALTDMPVGTLEEVAAACEKLIHQGVRRVFVSLGAEGMYYHGREGTIHRVARPFDRMVNATGAGDASMAGIVWASKQGMTADEILMVVMAAGMIAIASPDTISKDMTPENIEKMMKEYIV